ncbi:iron ABC transporter permease [Sulfurovum sp. bin170]|uniref:FecCD family ABC transporter permease n=1 Tax=Sulfurovum sp. bin170 TaxID=2695268 RepID=UPI0013DFED27|nr:iron ABC transporter permease [Sulfurovum sp. bin170]NEW60700.1 iron ABC transporter permease [Sulfurovum sp. bin170]
MRYIASLLSITILLLAPFYGQIEIALNNLTDPSTVDYKLFWDLRVPRVIVAFFAGGLLGLGGLIFQSLFKNPMGTPYTLGVASGSTLGVAFAIIFGYTSLVSLFGFVGALFTVIILFGITARLKSYESNSLLLVGIALSFFYSASLMILFYLSDESQSFEIVRFTMGSVDVVGMGETLPIVLASFGLLGMALWYRGELRLLLTSNDNAFLKGVEVKRVNTILLLVVSISTGVCVSITGPIGFVGLIIPHIIKIFYKQSADRLIAPIFFYSGVFLVLSDLIARNLGTNSDVPIGIITSFVGGPFFVYLIVRKKQ